MTRKQAQQIAADYKQYLTPEGHPKDTMPEDLKELGPEAIVELQTPEHTSESLHENPTTGEHTVSDPIPTALDAVMATMSVPLMFIPHQAKTLDEDKEFNKIQNRLKKAYLQKKWLEDKGRKRKKFDVENNEDLDFLYGSLDDPSTSVASQAEKIMREEAAKDPKKQKKLDRYDKNQAKVYKHMGEDPSIARVNDRIAEHAEARKAALIKQYRKDGKKIKRSDAFQQDYESIMKRIKESTWKDYVSKNPEKAAAYIAHDEEKKKKDPKYTPHDDSDISNIKRAYEAYQKEASQGMARPNSTNFSEKGALGPRYQTLEPTPPAIQTPPITSPPTIAPPVERLALPPSPEEAQRLTVVSSQPPPRPLHALEGKVAPQTVQSTVTNPNAIPRPVIKIDASQIAHAPVSNPPSTPSPSVPHTPTQTPHAIQPIPSRRIPSSPSSPSIPKARMSLGKLRSTINTIQHPKTATTNYVRNKAAQLGTRAARKIGSTLLRQGGRFLARAGAQVATSAAAAANPIVLLVVGIVVGVIILLLIILLLFSGGYSSTSTSTATGTISGLTLVLEDPISHQVQNGENITYTINATYTGTDEVTLSDPLPANTTFVSATGSYTNTNNTVSWRLNNPDIAGNTASTSANIGQIYRFTITLHPEQNDIIVKNKILANALGSGAGEPPNASNCNGKYVLNNPFNNFGDPSCNFNKDQAYLLIKQLDPANADKWFFKIMPCESNYNPNAYLRASTSGLGAFGLFQMNPKGQGNGQYDAGNVDWHVQIPNAISYNKLIGNSFAYWQCR